MNKKIGLRRLKPFCEKNIRLMFFSRVGQICRFTILIELPQSDFSQKTAFNWLSPIWEQKPT